MSSHTLPKFWAIIPAAGIGTRMQADKPKQYLQLAHKTILEHSLLCFLNHPAFDDVYVGLSDQDTYFEKYGLHLKRGVKTFRGGKERAGTVLNGLACIADNAKDDDWVWVHDAARPCLSIEDIDLLINKLNQVDVGLILGVPVSDTLKRVSSSKSHIGLSKIKETVDRSGLWRAMTPQVFKYASLRDALKYCDEYGLAVTDEASALENVGQSASMLHGSEKNIKVTLPADLAEAQEFLIKRQGVQDSREKNVRAEQEGVKLKSSSLKFPRIGTGFDVHAFGDGKFIVLGGVTIPHDNGLIAHSDGDVLLHAIMDALLGALALGDIGKHFPDTDEKWKGANSRVLLRAVKSLIDGLGYKLGNLDSTIIAQAPKMAPYILDMQKNIAEDLDVDNSCVAVKATTTEKLGFTGRKEGIACQASVILVPLLSIEELPGKSS